MKRAILTAIIFVVIFIAAFWGYKVLTKNNLPETETTGVEQTADVAQTTAQTEGTSSALAPNFTVLDIEGKQADLSDFFGKPIVINFWATWCNPCKNELPTFDKLYQEYGSRVNFLMVNLTDGRDTEEKVKEFISENEYTFPVYFDTMGDGAMSYGISTIPQTVFIDESGAMVDYKIGIMSEEVLRSYIEKILEPIGCTYSTAE